VPAAIEIRGVSKRFRLNTDSVKSLKERAMRFGRVSYSDFWALQDIEFDVAEGETIGLLGHNGSGKSTLLKCIGGILTPTTGEVRTRGRLASLLELGAGFHPELTGRENVFLNASILGISRKDIAKKFDEIVAFAELEQFIDNQVKHYSSGMYVRLGFAVAVNVEPDLLLVDEVLAVGDENFQRKCLERIHQFQAEGRTIVFVTHAADLVRQICDRAVVLDHGHMVAIGDPPDAIRTFRDHLFASRREREAMDLAAADAAAEAAEAAAIAVGGTPATATPDDDPNLSHGERQERRRTLAVRIADIEVVHPHSDEREHLLPGEPLTIRVHVESDERVEDVDFGIAVYDAKDGKELFGANGGRLGIEMPPVDGHAIIEFQIAQVPLLDGTFPFTVGIHSRDEGTVYDWSEQRHWFSVLNPQRTVGTVALPLEVTIKA
jgi:ABC-2 type transport system ATP-binding protein